MKHSTYPPLLVLTLILAACGGGGGGEAPVTAPAASSAQISATGDAPSSATATASSPATMTQTTTSATGTTVTAPATATSAPATPPSNPASTPVQNASPTQPATNVPTSTPTPPPVTTTPAAGWTQCAVEYGTCTFSGTRQVRYGLGDRWATLTATGSISCNNTIFGDPYPGAAKVCQVASTTSDTTPTEAVQVIEYYGDSTVWGYRTNSGGQVAKPAPVAFAESLPNPSAYVVRNEGVSGSTACELLNGTDGRHQPWASQMAASKAKYVFINHAINDQWKMDLNTYKGCLRSLAQTAKQYGKQMIFETPNPTRDNVGVMANAMKEVAAQENVPVVDQYKYLSDYLGGQSATSICPDGLHPTEAVYIMKGKYAAGVFATLFIK